MKYTLISKVMKGHNKSLLCLRPSNLIKTLTNVLMENICPCLSIIIEIASKIKSVKGKLKYLK